MSFISNLTSYLQDYEQQEYLQGSLLVADKTGILLQQHYGEASKEFSVNITDQTKYQIGSLTKAFTAMAILILHHQEKLNINDSIHPYIPDFPNGDTITIYHCLTCSSGVPDFVSFDQFWEKTMRHTRTLDEVIHSFQDSPLEFEPGSAFSYSTSGYLLLTKIIEIVSQQSYGEFLEAYIFKPLQMKNSGCNDGTKIIKKLASNYSYWGEEVPTPQSDMSFPLGGYGLYSTIFDLYLWDRAIRRHQLIPKELTQLMFTPYQGTYACGWDVSLIAHHKCQQHFGNISGFVSSIKQFEEDDFTIIFLSNLDIIPVTTITAQIAALKFGAPYLSQLYPNALHKNEDLKQFVGHYVTVSTQQELFEIVEEANELFMIVPKIYGILYKCKLVEKEATDVNTLFKTQKINEMIAFKGSNNIFDKIIYTDYQQQAIQVIKQQ